MDTILRNARVNDDPAAPLVDIGMIGGSIAAIQQDLQADGEVIDAGGRLVSPGLSRLTYTSTSPASSTAFHRGRVV